MSFIIPQTKIINLNQLYSLLEKYTINEVTDFNNNKVLVSYIDDNKIENIISDNYSESNINVAIASAITAYARIHMSQFKNRLDYNLYYSDTDSIIVDKPLESSLVGPNLGQMKLLHVFEEACFIAPKVYGGILEDSLVELTKVKGFKNKIHYQELTSLLNTDTSILTKAHNK